MKEFIIENEGHTVACLLREKLIDSSEFAACTVRHPLDTSLSIKLDAENPEDTIKHAIFEVQNELDNMLKTLESNIIHRNLEEMDVE